MSNEFIPYEQALELKELGFNEPCLASYETAFGKGIYFELGYIIDGPKNYVLTPLYQQAFRWFRDKGYHISIRKRYFQYGKSEFNYFIYPPNSNEHLEDNLLDEYETYEEAELACLKKLIEIVK